MLLRLRSESISIDNTSSCQTKRSNKHCRIHRKNPIFEKRDIILKGDHQNAHVKLHDSMSL